MTMLGIFLTEPEWAAPPTLKCSALNHAVEQVQIWLMQGKVPPTRSHQAQFTEDYFQFKPLLEQFENI